MSEVYFKAEKHEYHSVDIFEGIEWTSISRLAGKFRDKFDPVAGALKASKNRKSKWYGMPPNQIQEIWQTENKRSTSLGDWCHKKEENILLAAETTERYGKQLPIIKSLWVDETKFAPEQRLEEGLYPEHFVFLKSAGVCGQIDEAIVAGGYCHIEDWKSNKDLKKPAYVGWDGRTQKMLPPLLHLDDCKLVEYGLQLSIGLYIILRHNPQLKPGELNLKHITFEIAGENQYGYPIMKLDGNGEPVVKGVEKIAVPYLKREVELMFEWLKADKIKK